VVWAGTGKKLQKKQIIELYSQKGREQKRLYNDSGQITGRGSKNYNKKKGMDEKNPRKTSSKRKGNSQLSKRGSFGLAIVIKGTERTASKKGYPGKARGVRSTEKK